ncbi:MAG: ATP-binding cassette domain-containing protein [Zetaproteobacteria bacterium]|nr:ATP-binding cassette domain-containing protein [Zetaproteobacteria bacterium]
MSVETVVNEEVMQVSEGEKSAVRIEHTLIQYLFKKIEVPKKIKPKQFAEACEHANHSLPSVNTIEWLRHLFIELGVKGVQPIQLSWRRFDQRRLPALILYNDRWYLAERLNPMNNEEITLTDSEGVRTPYLEGALQDATVIWVRMRGKQKIGPAIKGNIAAKMMMRELFREPGWILKVLVATLIVNLFAVATSIFAMQVYDRVVPTQAYATLTTLVVGMGLIVAIDWFLKTSRARILDSMSCAVDKRTSQMVYDHLLHLRLDLQPNSLGTLAAQVGGLDAVRQFFSSGIIFILMDAPFAVMFIAVIALIGGKVAWVYAALLPISILIGYVTQRRLKKLILQQVIRSNERQGLLVDSIRGAESIRANNAAWRFSDDWRAITDSTNGYNIQQKAMSNFSMVTTGSLSTIAYVAAVVVGVWEIEAGNLSMGGLIACSILGGRVIAPIAQAVQQLVQWQHVAQALYMVNEVLKIDKERRDDQHLLLPDQAPQTLEVEKIRFAYPDSPIQQLDVSALKFSSGERILLVGPVGCGKSTLLKVLAGLYKPTEGRVLIGDADLWEIDPQVLASYVGYLPQSVHLFKGTLRSNLGLAGTSSDSRMLAVTRELGIDAIAASSSLGMELPISEGGDGLSGGQRQLVALARVMINQPRIWLLDEPTSSLDYESETTVWKMLEAHIAPEDILIVSTHRPMQAMALANRVIVMHQGQVVKDGKPENILPQLQRRPNQKAAKMPMSAGKPIGGVPHVV